MVTYKEIDFLDHIPDVKKCDSTITLLNDQWDNIKLLCEINCPMQSKKILPNMTRIQKSFYDLQQELIKALINESLNELKQKIVSKAQVAVDILIRNLYERTADVGFLATDDDICNFVDTIENRDLDYENIIKRLNEYVAKYSVYEEIIIFDTDFNVLANLDKDNPITSKINDKILYEALNTDQSFIEYFGPSLLQPQKRNSHLFLSKIYSQDTKKVCGIICLCFKFENEMMQIFKNLSNDYDGSVILIADQNNKVIASSDENHIPIGIVIETGDKDSNDICYYKGVEYICRTVCTQGYQGYFGLGFKGHIMIPLNLAFKNKTVKSLDNINKETLENIMKRADSFSLILNDIVKKTHTINNSLRQIVFNGQLLAKQENKNEEFIRLKPLLASIGKMGNNTSLVFDQSIKNLFSTIISTSLTNVSFLSSLCIDIMDRNLYERANDCRWWALNSTFKNILAKQTISEKDQNKLTEILSYINSLYTVYSNLFLFDADGKIIAVSNPLHSNDIGKMLNQQYIKEILENSHSEKYFVSPWEKSEFYNDKYTYIYGASITDLKNQNKIVGGIGIVFDSELQFEDMLNDALGEKDDCFAVFTNSKGIIISSTNKSLKIGDTLKLCVDLSAIKNGSSISEIVVYDDYYYSVGISCSSGYREYKMCDNYKNDVYAFVFKKLADYKKEANLATDEFNLEQSDFNLDDSGNHVKLVTFKINNQLFAIMNDVVIEAIGTDNIVQLPTEDGIINSAVEFNEKYVGVVDYTDLFGIKAKGQASNLLILEISKNSLVALKVDELSSILEVNQSDIKNVASLEEGISIVNGILSKSGENSKNIIILNHKVIFDRIEKNTCEDITEYLENL